MGTKVTYITNPSGIAWFSPSVWQIKRATVESQIVCTLCEDTTYIPFPAKVSGYNYSLPFMEFDGQGMTDIKISCSNHKGKLEHEYKTCQNYYRCKWKDNAEWDEESSSWISTGISQNIYNCVGARGPAEVAENFSYEYTVYYEGQIISPEAITVFLSYNAGTLVQGIDFDAPDRIIIPAGSSSAKIVLTTNTYCDDRTNLFIQIDPTSSVTSSVCDNVKSKLTCEPEKTYCEKVNDNCSVHYFFEPYGHRTKKANNM